MAKDFKTEIKELNIEVKEGKAILILHGNSQEADSIIETEALMSLRNSVKAARLSLVHYASVNVLPKETIPALLRKVKLDKKNMKAVVVSSSKFLKSLRETDVFDEIYFTDIHDPKNVK